MKLVVGLGNPGRKYEGTRHNVGYAVVAELARRYAAGRPKGKFHGETVEVDVAGQRVVLLCPTTYMNRSGASVAAAKDFYKLADEDLLIVCDDINLPLAQLRVRTKGSSGGQKGLADVIGRLGSEEVPRLRIGVGAPPEGWDAVGYVLGKFSKDEQSEMENAVDKAADAVIVWVRDGIAVCMNQYN